MTIDLTPELEKIVTNQLASGRFDDAEEVIGDALRLLAAEEKKRAADQLEIQREIDESTASLDRGESIDPDEFFAGLRERSRLRRLNAA